MPVAGIYRDGYFVFEDDWPLCAIRTFVSCARKIYNGAGE